MTSGYTAAYGAVLSPLGQVLSLYRTVLKMDPFSAEFSATAKEIRAITDKAGGGLSGTGAASRLLKQDILWGRISPSDVGNMQDMLRFLVVRTNGMGMYFGVIEPTREKFPVTPAPSVPVTPVMSRSPTRPSTPPPGDPGPDAESESLKRRRRPVEHAPSPLRQALVRAGTDASKENPEESVEKKDKHDSEPDWYHALARRLHHHKQGSTHASHHDTHLHFSLLQLAHSLSSPGGGRSSIHLPSTTAVGVFESQRYLNLEATRLGQSASPEMLITFVKLLQETCDELLQHCQDSLKVVGDWMGNVRGGIFRAREKLEKERKARFVKLEKVEAELRIAIEVFRTKKRCVLRFLFFFSVG